MYSVFCKNVPHSSHSQSELYIVILSGEHLYKHENVSSPEDFCQCTLKAHSCKCLSGLQRQYITTSNTRIFSDRTRAIAVSHVHWVISVGDFLQPKLIVIFSDFFSNFKFRFWNLKKYLFNFFGQISWFFKLIFLSFINPFSKFIFQFFQIFLYIAKGHS